MRRYNFTFVEDFDRCHVKFKTTVETRLRYFQYKMDTRILPIILCDFMCMFEESLGLSLHTSDMGTAVKFLLQSVLFAYDPFL